MTEKSWLWTGTATGDASLAPYEKNAFNRWFAGTHSLDNEVTLYILPGYLDDMLIEPLVGSSYSTLVVNTGIAVFKNYIYSLTEKLYFTINPLVSYPITTLYRYDSLVMRLDRNAQTVTLELLVGDEATAWPPTAPTLTQTDYDIYEVEVARVLVDSTSYVMGQQHITVYSRYLPTESQYPQRATNLIQNPEFMAIDDTYSVGTMAPYPACWEVHSNVAAYGSWSRTAAIAPQKRGYSFTGTNMPLTAVLSEIRQWIPLQYKQQDRANVLTYDGIFSLANATVILNVIFEFYTDALVHITGSDMLLTFRDAGIHHLHRTFSIPDNADCCYMRIYPSGTTNTFSVGQQALSLGYFTGGFRTYHTAMFYKNLPGDSSWNGDAKSTGNTTINLSASFGGIVPVNARAVILYVEAMDSGSAAGTPSIGISDYGNLVSYGTLHLQGLTNDYMIGKQFVAYLNQPFETSRSTNRGFTVNVTASGAATMDVWIYIVGIIT